MVGFLFHFKKEQWLLSLTNMLSDSLTWANSNFLNVQRFPSQDCGALSHLWTRTGARREGHNIVWIYLPWLICSCLAAAGAKMFAHYWLTSSLNHLCMLVLTLHGWILNSLYFEEKKDSIGMHFSVWWLIRFSCNLSVTSCWNCQFSFNFILFIIYLCWYIFNSSKFVDYSMECHMII